MDTKLAWIMGAELTTATGANQWRLEGTEGVGGGRARAHARDVPQTKILSGTSVRRARGAEAAAAQAEAIFSGASLVLRQDIAQHGPQVSQALVFNVDDGQQPEAE